VQIQKHIQKKRSPKKRELQPIDKMMYVVSFVYPLTVAPQIYKVYTTHNVQSLALTSWLLYVLFQLICVAYAVQRRLLPLIIEGTFWLIYYGMMVFAIIAFR
jgi:uncharacterized protein with PQ loop repeat